MEVEVIISPAAADEPPALERVGDDAARAEQQNKSSEPAERFHTQTEKLRVSPDTKCQRIQVGGLIPVVWGYSHFQSFFTIIYTTRSGKR